MSYRVAVKGEDPLLRRFCEIAKTWPYWQVKIRSTAIARLVSRQVIIQNVFERQKVRTLAVVSALHGYSQSLQ